jgi:hypothetical protein
MKMKIINKTARKFNRLEMQNKIENLSYFGQKVVRVDYDLIAIFKKKSWVVTYN